MNDEDKVKREHAADGTPGQPPGPTRRQFLGGLTTGTLAIGALSQAGCAPASPPIKTAGATPTTTVRQAASPNMSATSNMIPPALNGRTVVTIGPTTRTAPAANRAIGTR